MGLEIVKAFLFVCVKLKGKCAKWENVSGNFNGFRLVIIGHVGLEGRKRLLFHNGQQIKWLYGESHPI